MSAGLWAFAAELDLDEAETDAVVGQVIAVEEWRKARGGRVREKSQAMEMIPLRAMDADTLWLRRNYTEVMDEYRKKNLSL